MPRRSASIRTSIRRSSRTKAATSFRARASSRTKPSRSGVSAASRGKMDVDVSQEDDEPSESEAADGEDRPAGEKTPQSATRPPAGSAPAPAATGERGLPVRSGRNRPLPDASRRLKRAESLLPDRRLPQLFRILLPKAIPPILLKKGSLPQPNINGPPRRAESLPPDRGCRPR